MRHLRIGMLQSNTLKYSRLVSNGFVKELTQKINNVQQRFYLHINNT